jgi:hypothetical protein
LSRTAGNGEIIEAQITAQHFHALGLQIDETLLLTAAQGPGLCGLSPGNPAAIRRPDLAVCG